MIARSDHDQEEINRNNAEFWNELCGTQLARQLGITDDSPESLKKFDNWYMDFYPYLYDHIMFAEMKGQRVLEVGLGYGTVAQKLLDAGARYSGLDIAAGPVAMVEHRCLLAGIGDADIRQASILDPPFADGSFDRLVAIGCLHHTGNLPEAIKVVWRLLRPGGEASFMVYSAVSYRQFKEAPLATLKRKLATGGVAYVAPNSMERQRAAYDVNAQGAAAPQTEFVSPAELRWLCRDFSKVAIRSENIGMGGLLGRLPRPLLCRLFGPVVGLDLYCRVVK